MPVSASVSIAGYISDIPAAKRIVPRIEPGHRTATRPSRREAGRAADQRERARRAAGRAGRAAARRRSAPRG